jgi:hypothetical protein
MWFRRDLHLNLNPDVNPTRSRRDCPQAEYEVLLKEKRQENRDCLLAGWHGLAARNQDHVVRASEQAIARAASARRWILSFSSTLCT